MEASRFHAVAAQSEEMIDTKAFYPFTVFGA